MAEAQFGRITHIPVRKPKDCLFGIPDEPGFLYRCMYTVPCEYDVPGLDCQI